MNSLEEQKIQSLSPRKILRLLRDGNVRHQLSFGKNKNLSENCYASKTEQNSPATILSCTDCYILPETMFDQSAEVLHKAYAPGTIVSDEVLRKLEFFSQVNGSQLIIVLGHTRCRTIKDLYFQSKSDDSRHSIEKNRSSVARFKYIGDINSLPEDKFIDLLTEIYVRSSLSFILGKDSYLRRMVERAQVLLFGAIYDEDSGRIRFF